MIVNNDYINEVQKWSKQTLKLGIEKDDKGWSSQVENDDENENEVIDDICPEDSVSNVASKHCSKQSHGSRKSSCSAASACMTEKSNLTVCMCCSREHSLEECLQLNRGKHQEKKKSTF